MTHAPAFGMPRDAAQAIRAFPYAAFTLVTAIVLVCWAGIVDMPTSRLRAADVPVVEADARAAATRVPARAPEAAATVRGVVESIRPLQRVGDHPAEFEFIVRLRDRTARISRTVGRAQWHVGDPIMLMGGSASLTN